MSKTVSYLTERLKHMDYVMLLSLLCLLGIGTVMIYSSSSLMAEDRFSSNTFFLKKHVMLLTLTVLIMPVCYFLRFYYLEKLAPLLMLLGVIGLLATVFTPMGVNVNHATRWLALGPIKIQVSELLKPVFIIYVASYLARKKKKLHSFNDGLLPILIVLSFISMLIMMQPDFGSTAVIAVTCLMMLFVAGAKLGHLSILMLVGATVGTVLIRSSHYRMARLLSFLNPWHDPHGSGFQIIQSLIAFARGGLYGQGLGDGSQKLLYLPEAHTDFIFSVVGEELGLFGSIALILFFLTFVVQGLKLSVRLKDDFARYLAFGLSILIGIEAVFNMGVVMALLPTKGLTLPFISYGRSSLLSSMFCATLLLSLSSSINMSLHKTKAKESLS